MAGRWIPSATPTVAVRCHHPDTLRRWEALACRSRSVVDGFREATDLGEAGDPLFTAERKYGRSHIAMAHPGHGARRRCPFGASPPRSPCRETITWTCPQPRADRASPRPRQARDHLSRATPDAAPFASRSTPDPVPDP